jgi:NADH-quinone oxidoreductase subunit J
MEGLFFYLLAACAIVSALLTVTRRDAVASAFWLIFCFLCIAGLFALLNAHLMAILQILLYAGAVMVFFLFVTMFLGKEVRTAGRGNRAAFLLGLASIAALWVLLGRVADGPATPFAAVAPSYGSLERVSELLLTRHLFGFELVGLLLTAAVIGAVHLARREQMGARAAREVRLRSEEARRLREAASRAEEADARAAVGGEHHA